MIKIFIFRVAGDDCIVVKVDPYFKRLPGLLLLSASQRFGDRMLCRPLVHYWSSITCVNVPHWGAYVVKPTSPVGKSMIS